MFCTIISTTKSCQLELPWHLSSSGFLLFISISPLHLQKETKNLSAVHPSGLEWLGSLNRQTISVQLTPCTYIFVSSMAFLVCAIVRLSLADPIIGCPFEGPTMLPPRFRWVVQARITRRRTVGGAPKTYSQLDTGSPVFYTYSFYTYAQGRLKMIVKRKIGERKLIFTNLVLQF